jgi:hypothetical protein
METKEKESWTDLAEFKPNNLGQAWKLADILSKTSFSAGHKSAQDIFICISMGQQIGLNPFQAVQNISVINGRPTLWGDALLAVCQSHPEYAGVEMSFDEETQTATCKALRTGKPPVIESFSQAEAKQARLWGKSGPWSQYPTKMLKNRARTWALRTQFADALLGLISSEELEEPLPVAPVDKGQAVRVEESPTIELDTAIPQAQASVTVEKPKRKTKQDKAQKAYDELVKSYLDDGLTQEQIDTVREKFNGEPSQWTAGYLVNFGKELNNLLIEVSL